MPFYNDIPIIGKYLKSNVKIDAVGEEAGKKIAESEEFKKVVIGFSEKVSVNGDALSKIVAERPTNIHQITVTQHDKDGKEIPTEDKIKHIKTKLEQTSPAADAVKATISNALETTPEFNAAKQQYDQRMTRLDGLLAQVPNKYKAQDLIQTLRDVNAEARAALVNQQAKEKAAIQTNLENAPQNFQHFKTAMNINDDNEARKAIKAVQTELEKVHAKQLEALDKVNQDIQNKLHEAATIDMQQKIFIKKLAQQDATLEKQIEEIARQRAKNNNEPDAPTRITFSENKASLNGVTLDDVKFIKSFTNKQITKQEDGSFKLELWRHIFDSRYYLDPRQLFKADLTKMAHAIKASGRAGIEFNLSFDNPEIAMKNARIAYEAARETGFKDEKVTIKVKGKVLKAEELFKEEPDRLTTLNKRAARNDHLRSQIKLPPANRENLARLKAEIDAQAPPQPQPQPNPSGP